MHAETSKTSSAARPLIIISIMTNNLMSIKSSQKQRFWLSKALTKARSLLSKYHFLNEVVKFYKQINTPKNLIQICVIINSMIVYFKKSSSQVHQHILKVS